MRWQPFAIGAFGGLAAGLLGIGGGVVVVPLLVVMLGMDQRGSHATSLAAIVPASAFATIVYAADGDVSWPAFFVLTAGAVLGAPIGVRILAKAPERTLSLVYLAFAVVAGLRLLVAS